MKSWKDLFDWMEMTFYAVVEKKYISRKASSNW